MAKLHQKKTTSKGSIRWLDKFDNSLKGLVDPSIRKTILEGSENLIPSTSPIRKAKWVMGAMERLDGNIDDEITKRQILIACSCVFPKTRIMKLRKVLRATGSINALLKYMHKDQSCHGLSYYEFPTRKGNTIYVKKIPFNSKGYNDAKNNDERRCYCHCKMIRAEIDTILPTFCYCGAGWYATLWEGVLNKPVRVEVLRSLTRRDEICEFAIHLPQTNHLV